MCGNKVSSTSFFILISQSGKKKEKNKVHIYSGSAARRRRINFVIGGRTLSEIKACTDIIWWKRWSWNWFSFSPKPPFNYLLNSVIWRRHLRFRFLWWSLRGTWHFGEQAVVGTLHSTVTGHPWIIHKTFQISHNKILANTGERFSYFSFDSWPFHGACFSFIPNASVRTNKIWRTKLWSNSITAGGLEMRLSHNGKHLARKK